jgi:serine/threonine-protein kinase RsbW
MGHSPSNKLVIPSKLDQVMPVQDAILKQVEELGYPQQAVFAIRLALDEALANAVKHGNQLDPDKSVHITYEVTAEKVTIEICDEGPGFAPDDLPDPTDEANLSRPHGRGVMLMRAYMTEVTFNASGNCVRLVKTRDCPLPTAD